METFDEKLKKLDLPQGLKELLSLSLSDEIKQKLCSIPDDQVEKAIQENIYMKLAIVRWRHLTMRFAGG